MIASSPLNARKFLRAIDYEILRDVPVNGRVSTPLARCPARVCTILNEKRLVESGNLLVHNQTVFLEDKVHDWNWTDGKFRFYTRVAEGVADVLVAYAVETVVPADEEIMALSPRNFDPMTGKRL
ncbi:hypothetical protein [Acetobacter persici]|uniref:Uncharacterized protein n=1 Tax=Acetobacter persici TaxID=1076596 RepID=A0A1U9LJD7_9PROT|nr:hypothetical protein [Acetobacter persici]AQT06517.1 hypothetical protein A0U91_16040 [Acetobacter persici]